MSDSHLADRVPRITRAFVVTGRDLWPWLRIPLAPHLKSIAARMRSVRLVVVNSMMGEGRESEAEFFDGGRGLG